MRHSYCQWCGKETPHTEVGLTGLLGTCMECGHIRNTDNSNKVNQGAKEDE